MAVTLKVRAGAPLKATLNYWQPSDPPHETRVNTTGFTARLQLRATQRPGRILLNAHEWIPEDEDDAVPAGTVLRRIAPGSWRLILSGAVTRSLPATVSFELELANDSDPDDTTPLVSGVVLVEPQVVSNV